MITFEPAEPALVLAPDAVERWTEALDLLERDTERMAALTLSIYAAAGEDTPAVRPFALDDDLGPVPPMLRDRARAVIGQAESVQTELYRVRGLKAVPPAPVGELDPVDDVGAGAIDPDEVVPGDQTTTVSDEV